MKEILQLFRRDAEHAPPQAGDATSYTAHVKPRILHGSAGTSRASSAQGSREGSVVYQGERRATPPVVRKDDNIYGRRW